MKDSILHSWMEYFHIFHYLIEQIFLLMHLLEIIKNKKQFFITILFLIPSSHYSESTFLIIILLNWTKRWRPVLSFNIFHLIIYFSKIKIIIIFKNFYIIYFCFQIFINILTTNFLLGIIN